MPPAEHFAAAPQWEWWILGYFFFGGISGGSYALGTLLRLAGDPRDRSASQLAYVASFVALLPCPIFLIADLGQPLRFIHMLVDASPGGGLAFRPDSPMSLGSWALLAFGLFSFVSFLGALAERGTVRALAPLARAMQGLPATIWGVIGTGFGFFICGYTGVLLAVSNQAVWSDAGWALGGMFLASALAGSAALLLLLARSRRDVDPDTATRLEAADRYFVILETILIVVFLITLAIAGTIGKVLGVWIVLWLVVLIGLAAPIAMLRWDAARRWPPVAAPILALLGVLALRALVIFSAQI
ncbi:MAG: polysulfide reductase NrfD [Chloroflexota bacterium]|nr:polysulfide reductase NrfD [Chloroflexota bacterium]